MGNNYSPSTYLLLKKHSLQEISTPLEIVSSVVFSHFWEASLLKQMEAAIQRCSFKSVFLKSKKKEKIQKNTCQKVHAYVHFSKILPTLKVISSYIFEIQEQIPFLNKNSKVFETEIKRFEQDITTLFFLIEDKF